MARFTLPRDIYHGKDALDALKLLKEKGDDLCWRWLDETLWISG